MGKITNTKEILNQKLEQYKAIRSLSPIEDLSPGKQIQDISYSLPQPIDLSSIKIEILYRPKAPSWEELVENIKDLIGKPGYLETRIKDLFEAGYGAELITTAEIARETSYKSPTALFMRSTSKSGGNWDTVTLKIVKENWLARRRTLDIIDQLGITGTKQIKLLLALCHRLKDRIYQFLSIATKEPNIKNPKGLFFSLAYKTAYRT